MGVFHDRIMETSITTGTGDITLAGAVAGYRTFTSVESINVFFDYCIEAVDANGVPTGAFEVGEGYLSSGTVLVRSTVASSSNANALVSFAAGTKRVFMTISAVKMQDKGQILAMNNFLLTN